MANIRLGGRDGKVNPQFVAGDLSQRVQKWTRSEGGAFGRLLTEANLNQVPAGKGEGKPYWTGAKAHRRSGATYWLRSRSGVTSVTAGRHVTRPVGSERGPLVFFKTGGREE